MNEQWVETTLGDVAEWGSGGTPKAGDPRFYQGGTIPWAVIGDVQDGPLWETRTYITMAGADQIGHTAPAGAVLVTMYGTIGRVAIAQKEMATNQAIAWAVPRDNRVDANYLFLWLRGHQTVLEGMARGATQRNINRQMLKEMAIRVPPQPVQRRIVDLMAHLDDHLTNLQAEQVEARKAREARSEQAMEAAGGDSVRLGDVLTIARGGSPRPIDDYFTSEADGLNWIKIGDVSPGSRYITSTAQKIRKEGLSKTRAVRTGDFLLSNSMSFGRPYILKIDGCIHDGWLVLSGVEDEFDPDYLYFLLRSRSVQAQFSSLAAGSGVKNLNIKVVGTVEVPIPAKSTQEAIAAELSLWADVEDRLEDEISTLSSLRKRILSSLLSGGASISETDYDHLLAEVS